MQFNEKALENKLLHLDEILHHEEICHHVISRHITSPYELILIPRAWNPAGGATLFQIDTENKSYFLKVKHRSVTVESKLEEESSFSEEPSLLNEHRICQFLKEKELSFFPKVLFFDEYEGFQFLASEFIETSLQDWLDKADIKNILQIWNNLQNDVQKLYENGIVHCDLHEQNIRIRVQNEQPEVVIIDWEESRFLHQRENFEESLDYIGRNKKSSLGICPIKYDSVVTKQINSLDRIRQVFVRTLLPKIEKLMDQCNYESGNGICNTIDHGHTTKMYQSVQNHYFRREGQRSGKKDIRIDIIINICKKLMPPDFVFLDVGSNNGLFGRELSKAYGGTIRCIGLEGFERFNLLADSLAFLENCKNIENRTFYCGEDDLSTLKITKPCLMTICSVWHHIINKAEFLKQIEKLDIRYIVLEMATQKECYQRTWQEELSYIQETLNFKRADIIFETLDYHRPLILLQKKGLSPLTLFALKQNFKKHSNIKDNTNAIAKFKKKLVRIKKKMVK